MILPASPGSISRLRVLILIAALGVSACASFNPVPLDQLTFRKRVQTEEQDGLRVSVAGTVTRDEPKQNLLGSPWWTDGDRAVLWLSPDPVALEELEFIELGARLRQSQTDTPRVIYCA